jgi:IS5 family transposase
MKQQSFAVAVEFERFAPPTRRAKFLSQVDVVIPWAELVALNRAALSERRDSPSAGRSGADAANLLSPAVVRLSGPAVEDALYDSGPFVQRLNLRRDCLLSSERLCL